MTNIGTRVFNFIDKVSHRLPPALTRIIAMPVNYHNNTVDNYVYERAKMINFAFSVKSNNQIPGDYAEFGVFRGDTFIEAYQTATKIFNDKTTKLWAFDSFEGLPEISGKDVDGPFSSGQFACSLENFKKNLKKNQVDMSRVKIVEGYFDKSLSVENVKELSLEKVSIAWIDCDLYESTVPVLNFLTDRLSDGSVLIFDDWFNFITSKKGEALACAEWLEANPQIKLRPYRNFQWAGLSFIVEYN